MFLNKLSKKVLSTVVLTAGLMTSSQALAENVGGVVWDPDSLFDFTSTSALYEDILQLDPNLPDFNNMLSGFGQIDKINGLGQTSFCPSGCELTYQFGGFTVATVDDTDPNEVIITFTGGWVNFYVDSATAFDPNNMASAGDGALWLSMAGHEIGGISLTAELSDFGAGADLGDGKGFLDVTGGLAAANFDTNTQEDGSDWTFGSSFEPLPGGGATADGFELFGSADFAGTSVSVPEPSSLALLGLGMLGLGFGARRKTKK